MYVRRSWCWSTWEADRGVRYVGDGVTGAGTAVILLSLVGLVVQAGSESLAGELISCGQIVPVANVANGVVCRVPP